MKNIKLNKDYLAIALIWLFASAVTLIVTDECAKNIDDYNIFKYIMHYFFGWKGFHKSDFPEVSGIYFSLIWFTFPFFIKIAMETYNDHINNNEIPIFRGKMTFFKLIHLLMMIIILLALFIFVVKYYDGSNLNGLNVGTSKNDLALFGIIFPFISAHLLTIVVFCIKKIKEWRIS